ncbi:MAG: hypothetical protein WDW38_008275 [Sanguina aurantia]
MEDHFDKLDEEVCLGYNRDARGNTLVGNWVEERALLDLAAAVGSTPEGLSSTPVEDKNDALTHPRIVEHGTTQLLPQDWRTLYQMSYDPTQTWSQPLAYAAPKKAGPRERAAAAALMEEARNLPAEALHGLYGAPNPPTLHSTYRGAYIPQELSRDPVGQYIMRDRDGRPATRDATFLAETSMMTKHLADRKFAQAAVQAGLTATQRLSNADIPVTIYSESVAFNKYEGRFQGTRALASAIPFNKQTTFTKPMSEYSKVVENE